MEYTWRWFGPSDKITLQMLKQIGVQGIVTALYDVPNGEIWTREAVHERRQQIEDAGLRWSVVERLPVSEAIKYAGPERDKLIENYIVSLKNLATEGVKTICYNFMPVIDWVRTELEHPNPDGTSTLYFSRSQFAYFDICVLRREGAEKEYSPEILAEVEKLKTTMTPEDDHRLIDAIIVKTQGFVSGNISENDKHPVELFRRLLEPYKGISKQELRENMRYFLEAIMPTCRAYDINMCVHPDDPPFSVFGLPRIVTCEEDIEWFLNAVNDRHNGLTFCSGSLSAGAHNDVATMARRFAGRTHFIHLRSCKIYPNGDFAEASHLHGRVDLVDLARVFEIINPKIPMRVDHGYTMLGDYGGGYNPGYGLYGRMYALAQLQGIVSAVDKGLGIE